MKVWHLFVSLYWMGMLGIDHDHPGLGRHADSVGGETPPDSAEFGEFIGPHWARLIEQEGGRDLRDGSGWRYGVAD